jgi:hypothetical protein
MMRPEKKYGICFPESLRRFSLIYFWLEKAADHPDLMLSNRAKRSSFHIRYPRRS